MAALGLAALTAFRDALHGADLQGRGTRVVAQVHDVGLVAQG